MLSMSIGMEMCGFTSKRFLDDGALMVERVI